MGKVTHIDDRRQRSTTTPSSFFDGSVLKVIKPGGYQRCAFSHSPLKLGGPVMFGGACNDPVYEGCDIYVGLDDGFTPDPPYPWSAAKGPLQVKFTIIDQAPPENVPEFRYLIEWLCGQILEGRSVHVGCIGGHGRTGMVMAAVVASLGVSETPIAYVRDNYCRKAVESQEQVTFLRDVYGCELTMTSPRHVKPRGVNAYAKARTTALTTGLPCEGVATVFGAVLHGQIDLDVTIDKSNRLR